MNKFLSVALLMFSFSVAAQKVTVTRQPEKIKTENAEVFSATLQGSKDEVTAALTKFLKEIGKVRQGAEIITISDPVLNGTAFTKKIFYAFAKGDDKTTSVWLGLIESEWESSEINYANRELEKLTYQFGIKFYQDKVQAQIDETQQALDAVERQQQRLTNQNKDLNTKLVNNEQQKIQLEKSLENNKLEHAVLLQKIENNKKAQDSLLNVGVQIQKVLEQQKEKQRKIN